MTTNQNLTVENLTKMFQSLTSGVVHSDANCSVNRRRQVVNMPISERDAAWIIANPELVKFCNKCN